MTPKVENLIQVNVAVLIWGGTAMFAKGIDLPVGELTCLRSVFCAGALFLFIGLRKQSARLISRRDLGLMLILGALLCLHWLTYFQALKISSAAVAILALHTYPVITALIEPVLFGEPLRKTDLAVAMVAFTGLFIMMPAFDLSNRVTQGILIGIVSGLFFMTRNLMLRKLLRTYSSSHLMFWQSLVSGFVLIPILLTSGEAPYTMDSILLIALLGVVFTAIPQTLFASGLKNLSAKTVGIMACLLPLYGAFFGYWVHNEQITLRTMLGGSFILACVVYETASQTAPNKAEAQGN